MDEKNAFLIKIEVIKSGADSAPQDPGTTKIGKYIQLLVTPMIPNTSI